MKIITDNRESWSKEVTCSDCNSILEIEEEDVKQGRFGMAGHYDNEFFVECAVCAQNIFIKFAELPSFVRDRARREYEDRN